MWKLKNKKESDVQNNKDAMTLTRSTGEKNEFQECETRFSKIPVK